MQIQVYNQRYSLIQNGHGRCSSINERALKPVQVLITGKKRADFHPFSTTSRVLQTISHIT